MKEIIRLRVIKEAERIVESKKTLRELACEKTGTLTKGEFGVSKSTIHKDMQQKLIYLDKSLYKEVQKVFLEHLESRYSSRYERNKKSIKK